MDGSKDGMPPSAAELTAKTPRKAAAKKAKAKRPTTKPKAKKVAKKARKVTKSKAKRPKPKAKVPKARTIKPRKPAKTVERSERLDLRVTKADKDRVVAKAKRLRRTITSILTEAVEKIR